jgi:hypothetical protein
MTWMLISVLTVSLSPVQASGVVAGVVVRGAANEPARGVAITLQAVPSQVMWTGQTDGAGRFQFRFLPAGSYQLSVTPGNVTPVTLRDGESVPGLVIRFNNGRITGRIFNAISGETVAGLGVELLRKGYDELGQVRFQLVTRAVTSSQGEYALSDVPALEEFYLATGTAANGRVYRRTYFRSVVDSGSAAAIRLAAGEELSRMDFSVTPGKLVTIRGRLIDALNVRQPHLSSVSLLPRDSSVALRAPLPRADVEADGSFELKEVPPGSYYVIGKRIDDEPNRSAAVATADVIDTDIENLDLITAEGHEVRGRVRWQSSIRPDLRIAVLPSQGGPPELIGRAAGPRPDGTFTIGGLPSGEYRLAVDGLPPGYYLQSARFGQIDLLERAFVLRDVVMDTLELVLSANGGRIEGIVTDAGGFPAASFAVAAIPLPLRPDRPDLNKSVLTDAEGRFSLSGIAPGRYEVLALRSFDPTGYRNTELMRWLRGRGETIEVRAGEVITLQLTGSGTQ